MSKEIQALINHKMGMHSDIKAIKARLAELEETGCVLPALSFIGGGDAQPANLQVALAPYTEPSSVSGIVEAFNTSELAKHLNPDGSVLRYNACSTSTSSRPPQFPNGRAVSFSGNGSYLEYTLAGEISNLQITCRASGSRSLGIFLNNVQINAYSLGSGVQTVNLAKVGAGVLRIQNIAGSSIEVWDISFEVQTVAIVELPAVAAESDRYIKREIASDEIFERTQGVWVKQTTGEGISLRVIDEDCAVYVKRGVRFVKEEIEIPELPVLSDVATSGNYGDLKNKPAIPAAQVPADWNATSGAARILNKPDIPTLPVLAEVATSGNYGDLTGKPDLETLQAYIRKDDFGGYPQIINTGITSISLGNSDGIMNIAHSNVHYEGSVKKTTTRTTSVPVAAATQSKIGFMSAADKTKLDKLVVYERINNGFFATHSQGLFERTIDIEVPAGKKIRKIINAYYSECLVDTSECDGYIPLMVKVIARDELTVSVRVKALSEDMPLSSGYVTIEYELV